jgi:hypothetical protein
VASEREYRSRAVAREFKREHPCPSTGLPTGPCPGYWKDHIVPLACGGPDAVSNLQNQATWGLGPEPLGRDDPDPNPKESHHIFR